MNEDERAEKTLIYLLFSGCIVLLILVLVIMGMNSPKYLSPKFTEEIAFEEKSSEEVNPSCSEMEISEDEKEEDIFPININTATSAELEQIPDIGPATAKLIIEYREEFGTIVIFDELLNINGIGEKTLEIIKEYCIIN